MKNFKILNIICLFLLGFTQVAVGQKDSINQKNDSICSKFLTENEINNDTILYHYTNENFKKIRKNIPLNCDFINIEDKSFHISEIYSSLKAIGGKEYADNYIYLYVFYGIKCSVTPKSNETIIEADFYTNTTNVVINQNVIFEDLSLSGISSWNWTFEGGIPATFSGQTPPPIKYTTEGTFDVTLMVSDGTNSDTYTRTDYITVDSIIVPSVFQTIQQAIDFVKTNSIENAEIKVLPGTYRECINFKGTKNIKVIGDESNPSTTIIDGSGEGTTVSFVTGEDLTTQLSGFTIQNTDVSGNNVQGRGIEIIFSSPKLKHLIIQKNSFGASSKIIIDYLINEVYNKNSDFEFSKIYKILSNPKTAREGSGILAKFSNFELSNSIIKENGNTIVPGNQGGGIYFSNSNVSIQYTIINNNTAREGGGIFMTESTCNFNNVAVKSNSAAIGAGIWTGSKLITNKNLIIFNNTATVEGGGVHSNNDCRIKEIVLVGNQPDNCFVLDPNIIEIENITALNSKTGIFISGSNADIKNSIIRNNTCDIDNHCISTNISYSNYTTLCGYYTPTSNNINLDPKFIATKDGNYYLQPTSPCINSGNPAAIYNDEDQTRNDMGACRNNITGFITGNSTVCTNSISNFIIEVCSSNNFKWSIPTGSEILEGQGTNQITARFGANSGDVNVIVTSTNQTVNSEPFALTINNVPNLTDTISGEKIPCINSSAIYSVSAVSSADGYLWTFPNTWSFEGSTNSINAVVGTTSGIITVTPYNQCGNGISKTMQVYAGTQISGPTEVTQVESKSVIYSVKSISTSNTYNWIIPNGWAILSGQGTNTINVKVYDSGFLNVNIKNELITANYYCPLYVTYINSDENNFNFTLFPNPNSGLMKVLINSKNESAEELSIYNLIGKKIISYSINDYITEDNILRFNISGFASGIYIVVLKTNKNKYYKKLFKE